MQMNEKLLEWQTQQSTTHDIVWATNDMSSIIIIVEKKEWSKSQVDALFTIHDAGRQTFVQNDKGDVRICVIYI